MKTNGFIVAAALAALALSGCAQTESQQRAGTGALIGGAGGALVGQAIGRDTKSTVIGAATMVSALGMALGPALGGWIFDTFGTYGWLYVASSAIGFGAAAIALAFPPFPSERRAALSVA